MNAVLEIIQKFRATCKIFAFKGEIVCCENGHPIAKIRRDLFENHIFWMNLRDALFLQPIRTKRGGRHRCDICDGNWYVGGKTHFSDGTWRL